MRKKWVAIFILWSIIVAACGGQSQDASRLDFSSDAKTLVIYADEVTTPGGFIMGQECNHIPRLRIWGDGRTIYSEIKDGKRQVLVGQSTPEQITEIVQKLDSLQYFTNPPDSSMNGAGSGYRIGIKLKKGSHDSFWSEPNVIYQALVETYNPSGLADFQPAEGYLVVGPKLRKELFPSPPVWSADYGFHLADADASDRTVSGPTLDFLWQAINNQPEPLTGIQDGDSIYAVAVFVKDISLAEPPYKCWNK
jgi:hypothetical protein